MDTGTGIAIAGMWVMVAMFGMAKQVTGGGTLLGMAVAVVMTLILL